MEDAGAKDATLPAKLATGLFLNTRTRQFRREFAVDK